MKPIGEKISELRKSKNMTQEDLANAIGVSAQSVSKWENSTTMPDIMLLPVLADIFGVSIDELFGKSSEHQPRLFGFDDIVDEAYDNLLRTMQQAWYNADTVKQTSSVILKNGEPAYSFDDSVALYKKSLEEDPRQQTAIYSNRNGAVYCDSVNGGLIFKKPKDGYLSLLEDANAISMIEALADKNFRTMLLYQLKNKNVSYTKSSIAKKCSLSEQDAETTIRLMEKLRVIASRDADIDGEIIKIYSLNSGHKILFIYAILAFGKRFAEYQENYRGFRGDGDWSQR